MTDAELRQRLERQAQRRVAIARTMTPQVTSTWSDYTTSTTARVHDWAAEERGMCRDLWIWAWVSALVIGAIVTSALALAWWLARGA